MGCAPLLGGPFSATRSPSRRRGLPLQTDRRPGTHRSRIGWYVRRRKRDPASGRGRAGSRRSLPSGFLRFPRAGRLEIDPARSRTGRSRRAPPREIEPVESGHVHLELGDAARPTSVEVTRGSRSVHASAIWARDWPRSAAMSLRARILASVSGVSRSGESELSRLARERRDPVQVLVGQHALSQGREADEPMPSSASTSSSSSSIQRFRSEYEGLVEEASPGCAGSRLP